MDQNSKACEPTEPETSPSVRRFISGSVGLSGRSWGQGAPAVVLLHGLASNARIWDGVASRLLRRGLSVLALDLRGHGLSDQPRVGYDFGTVADDLDAVLEQVDAESPVIVGHSWGAHVALYHAVHGKRRGAGLVLLDGGYLDYRVIPGLSPAAAEARLAPPRWAMPLESWLESAWLGPEVHTTGGWVKGFLEAGAVVGPDGLARSRLPYETHLAIAHELVEQEPRQLFSKVMIPFRLCIATREDLPLPKAEAVERVRSSAPAGLYCKHEGVSHDLPLFEPERIAEEIADFQQVCVPKLGGFKRSAQQAHSVSPLV